jgi:alcohol dehydrogenase
VDVRAGLVDTRTIPTLLGLIAAGRLDPQPFTTHRFPLKDAMDAYDTFAGPPRPTR